MTNSLSKSILNSVGVHPFIDENGNIINKPTLDKLTAKVQPGLTVQREMKIAVSKGFLSGELYETDIVIREKTHNQNICVKLYVNQGGDVLEAAPFDEKDLDMHFHHWYHHYYCQEHPIRGRDNDLQHYSKIESLK